MNYENIMDALATISKMDREELQTYSTIVEMNMAQVQDENLDETQQKKLELLVATKTNYEIMLCNPQKSISSFKAGDVEITEENSAKAIESAREMYLMALEDAAQCLEDMGFVFMGV